MNQLQPPDEFPFPFSPYDIQKDFMRNLFLTLEKEQLGIFESPTGTGKSLSLICGALTWLRAHNEHHKAELMRKVQGNENVIDDDDGSDWFTAATKRREEQEQLRRYQQELQVLEKQEQRMQALKERQQVIKRSKVKKIDDEFEELFRDLQEVRENVRRELSSTGGGEMLSPDELMLLLDDYDSDEEEGSKYENEEEDDGCLKIYYCSRTHSQLSQFIREVQKTIFGDDVRVISLASRQNLCVNEVIKKLGNMTLINEKCLDLQRGKKSQATKCESNGTTSKKKCTSSGCPYFQQSAVKNLADQLLLEVQDMEQMVVLGSKIKSCPYYGARYAIKDAQLVVLPYNTLLHKGTREACGIKLKGNVVIVDEAHNLLETISNVHSVIVSHRQLCGAHAQLSQYSRRYETRLSPRNLLHIRQILFFINALIKLLSGGSKAANSLGSNAFSSPSTSSNASQSQIFTVSKFLCDTLTDNLNLFKLVQYIEKSKIAHKLHSFSQHFEGSVGIHHEQKPESSMKSSTSSFLAKMASQKPVQRKAKENVQPAVSEVKKIHEPEAEEEEILLGSPLMQITEFLRALLHCTEDGRVVVNVGSTHRKSSVKYLLLNPASHFHDVVSQCRSVIVAGGTMRPVSEFREQLFLSAGADPSRVHEFSCGHVVPGEQIMPIALTKGPTNVTLDFTYQHRGDPKMLDELGRVLVNTCTVVPGGVVCFLPSYDYEQRVYSHFTNSGVISRLSAKKRVFREPRKSNELDSVLSDYAKTIHLTASNATGITGSLLFSVVGGKMSEGINFSDNLGRCVVMVGLPFPNTHSPELKEKMEFLNKYLPRTDGKPAGSVFYENLCFKAVNQSIGRAIRHRNDYASILLLDHRYCRLSSIQALPEWISRHVHQCVKFGQAFGFLRKIKRP
ncbi:ATP-dependent DNA helicase DDX11 isoform X2 [Panulirus ornatus]|uniref:ATP-dependent DNA helicase DDX11 isoform X2 n=1 Tax=Panulirus ornatus TaxID=150431 RepID=UPI003A87222F